MAKKKKQTPHVNQYARNSGIVDTMNNAARRAGISATEAEKIVRGTLEENFNDQHRDFVSVIGGNDKLLEMREKLMIG